MFKLFEVINTTQALFIDIIPTYNFYFDMDAGDEILLKIGYSVPDPKDYNKAITYYPYSFKNQDIEVNTDLSFIAIDTNGNTHAITPLMVVNHIEKTIS